MYLRQLTRFFTGAKFLLFNLVAFIAIKRQNPLGI